jgi:hypothetical protein
VYNDLGSGSNVDLCIITAGGVEYLRNYEYLQGKTYTRQFPVKYPPGTAREWQGGWGGGAAYQHGRLGEGGRGTGADGKCTGASQ